MQRLAVPIRNARITADYKAELYFDKYGYNHFGVDITSKDDQYWDVFSLGYGKVIDCGLDGIDGPYSGLGYVIIIRYDEVLLSDGSTIDLVATMCHLQEGSIAVEKGQEVTPETYLAKYGRTGSGIEGEHLHLQFDSDVDHPYACTGISGKTSKILKRGTVDSTIKPITVLNNYTVGLYKNRKVVDVFPNEKWATKKWLEIGDTYFDTVKEEYETYKKFFNEVTTLVKKYTG